jgi:hypothetical protein
MTPTARTLQALRKDGYTAEVVEKWNAYAKVRNDLFGIIDVLAVMPNEILGIQATSGSNVSARVAKAKAAPKLLDWLAARGRFEIWGWRKLKRSRKYEVRIVVFELLDGELISREV